MVGQIQVLWANTLLDSRKRSIEYPIPRSEILRESQGK